MISKAVKEETHMFAPAEKLQKTIACYLSSLQHPGCATLSAVVDVKGMSPQIIRQLMTYCDHCQKGKKMKRMCSTSAKD